METDGGMQEKEGWKGEVEEKKKGISEGSEAEKQITGGLE